MLKQLTKADWLQMLQIPEERIPAALILRGTRNLKRQYEAMLPKFINVLEIGSPQGIVEDVLIGDYEGSPVGFACVYGAPMASEIVHIFGELGTRLVIQIGNCGALADALFAGDIFLASVAYCGEGAAQYYKTDGKQVAASQQLLQELVAANPDLNLHSGPIFTTSALFAEGLEDLDRWHGEGFAAVDMETAATFAVAEYFAMQRLSMLYVCDNPRRKEHLLITDAEKELGRRQADNRIKEAALNFAVRGHV